MSDVTEPGSAPLVSLPCMHCGKPVPAGQHFCGHCGATVDGSAPQRSQQSAGVPPIPPPPPGASGYSVASKLFAADMAISHPLGSMLAAQALQSTETDPLRQASLRTWRAGAAVALVVGVLTVIIIAVTVASSAHHTTQPSHSGPCSGGPVMGAAGTSVGNGNYRFDCAFGGTTVVHLGN